MKEKKAMTIKDLKKGDFFTLKNIENPTETQVWIRGDYDRSSKTYDCTRFDDICRTRSMKPTATVYVDFIF